MHLDAQKVARGIIQTTSALADNANSTTADIVGAIVKLRVSGLVTGRLPSKDLKAFAIDVRVEVVSVHPIEVEVGNGGAEEGSKCCEERHRDLHGNDVNITSRVVDVRLVLRMMLS